MEDKQRQEIQDVEFEMLKIITDIRKELEQKSDELKVAMEDLHHQQILNSELENKIAEQGSLIGPFREQLELYEMEHSALLSQKSDAENEAKQMGLKYAQFLEHENQKQKIKHLVDLKYKNRELREQSKEIEIKVRVQAKTIEKLKKELQSKSPKN